MLFTDQLNHTISIDHTPKRIVSLVPSQTELLYDLGLDETVVGITKFCIHPEHWFRGKTRVGGTKTLHIETITQLQPDLIIANKEENMREQVEALKAVAPVWISDVKNLDSAIAMIQAIGQMTGRAEKAGSITALIRDEFSRLPANLPSRSAAYLIWKEPYMAAGGDTFINDMMLRCGLQNVFADRERYPEVTIEELLAADAGVVLLSSEPYPFKEQHLQELQEQLQARDTRILLADGEMFSWYGSRLQHAPAYFRELVAEL